MRRFLISVPILLFVLVTFDLLAVRVAVRKRDRILEPAGDASHLQEFENAVWLLKKYGRLTDTTKTLESKESLLEFIKTIKEDNHLFYCEADEEILQIRILRWRRGAIPFCVTW